MLTKHAPFLPAITHNGYDYRAKSHHPATSPICCYYNCCHDRATKSYAGCPAKLTMSISAGVDGFKIKEGSYSHTCDLKAVSSEIIDCTEEAKALASTQSLIRGVNAQQAAKMLSFRSKKNMVI